MDFVTGLPPVTSENSPWSPPVLTRNNEVPACSCCKEVATSKGTVSGSPRITMRQKQRDLFPRFPSSSSLFQQKATGGPPKKYTNINQRRPTPILYSLDQLCHSCRTPFDSAPIDNDDHPTGDPATSDDELGLPGTTAPQARPRPDIRRGSEHIVPCFLESAGCPQRTPSPSPRAVRTSPVSIPPVADSGAR